MTITTSGPQETAKTRQAPQATTPKEPKPIEECVTVTNGPPDASTSKVDASEANGFRSSTKMARTPPQAKAEPAAQTNDKHNPPHAPRRSTRVKKLQPIDFAELEDDKEVEGTTEPKPGSSESAKREPTTRIAAKHEPAMSEPTMQEPATCEPATSEPTTREPATREPVTREPATREPIEMLQAIEKMVGDLAVLRSSDAVKSKILKSIAELVNALKEQHEPAQIRRSEESKASVQGKTGTKSTSWAQVVAASPGQRTTLDIHLEMAKRERLEKLKKERAKTEVTISTRSATDDVQRDIDALKEKDLTKLLEEHIHRCLKAQGKQEVSIKRVWKVAKHVVKIQCNSMEDAALVKELNWEELLTGAQIAVPMYGLVVHGAPKHDIDVRNGDIKEVKENIESANQITVKHARPLMRKPRNSEAPTESIVIFTEHIDEANACINDGLRVGRRILHVERYAPQYQIRQCFRCQGYGHRAENCTRDARCGKCGSNHETHKCSQDNKTVSCAHCQGSHTAWHHSCPRRQKEVERLEILRATLPPHFQC
jgi:hypothetical protein